MAKITYGQGGSSNTKVNAKGETAISPIVRDEDGNEVNLVEALKGIEQRLLILEPNFRKHEKYPALKELYEQYKMLEALMIDDEDQK